MTSRLVLPRAFYRRKTTVVARDLIGRVLARRIAPRQILRGTIVEVEAYAGFEDQASHAFRGRTARNEVMFARGGLAYVYLIYGMHHCFNVVTESRAFPAAILIRATTAPAAGVSASGPGRLTRAFAIDRSFSGTALTGGNLWLEKGNPQPQKVIRGKRVGVDYAGHWATAPLRFAWKDHPELSRVIESRRKSLK